METTEKIRCLIVGSGPAGYTAAIYAARANLSPVLYEGIQPGGQLTTTTDIENFPGYPEGVSGTDMMEQLRQQAARFGTDIRIGIVTDSDFSQAPYRLTIDGEKIVEANAVIIATGASAKYLGLPDETKYAGQGVSACATCDGFFYRKKVVAVVGGGDTACEEAISKIMQERVMESENIEVLFETQTVGLFGENGVEGAHLVKYKGTDREEYVDIAIDGFFLAIGHTPNTKAFPAIATDEAGYIITNGRTTATNIPGVFAAGDVADPLYRQAITAAAAGCRAAIDTEKYLLEKCL